MSYNHIEPQSLNDYNHNTYMWKNIYKNPLVVSEPMVRSDWPHNHNHNKKGHSYTWREIYHMKKKQGTHPWEEIVGKSQSLTLDKIDKVVGVKLVSNVLYV